MFAELLVSQLASTAFQLFRDHLKIRYINRESPLRVDERGVQEAVRHHLTGVERWADELAYSDLEKPRRLLPSFVELDLNVEPVRLRGRRAPDRTYRISSLVPPKTNCVLLGDPGAGKTTSLKKIAADLLARLSQWSEGDQPFVPILIRLRDVPRDERLVDSLLAACGLRLDLGDVDRQRKRQEAVEVLCRFLNDLGACVLLDGLDEVYASSIDDVVHDIRQLLLAADKFRLIITCRSGAYTYSLPNCDVLEISPLSTEQVREFTTKWLGEKQARKFVKQIQHTPYAGSELRPLTLAQLCAIFQRRGRVPEKPKSVYRMIVRLYIEDWDAQRSVRRVSRYAGFELDRKEEFLEALAFSLTVSGIRGSFLHSELQEVYLSVCTSFDLPVRDASRVAREIESHTGLIVEVGRDEYDFTHKSLQEFLAAQFLVRLARLPARTVLKTIPNELAIAIAISSRPSEYFSSTVSAILPPGRIDDEDLGMYEFTHSFLSRVLLEGAEFSPTLEFAAALLALLAHAYCNRPAAFDERQRLEFNQLVEQMLSDRRVREALVAISSVASFRLNQEEMLVVELDYFFIEKRDPDAGRLTKLLGRPPELVLPPEPFALAGIRIIQRR
jgi:hypothetical protein